MYYLLSVLSGMVIAIMIAINGELAGSKGLFLSTVLIHVVGLVCVLAFMTVRKIQPLPDRGVPARFYLGGVIGVATVVCNSIGFGGISVSALTALGLLGQSLTSLSIDQFGWLGMPKRALDRRKWIGIAIAAIGILCMLSTYSPDAALPVAVSLLAGVTIDIADSQRRARGALRSGKEHALQLCDRPVGVAAGTLACRRGRVGLCCIPAALDVSGWGSWRCDSAPIQYHRRQNIVVLYDAAAVCRAGICRCLY